MTGYKLISFTVHNHTNQNVWNVAVTLDFLILLAIMFWAFARSGFVPVTIGAFDAILIALASFRITRLIVRDTIFQFVRDLFLENGKEPDGGWRRATLDLLGCIWCTGIWVGFLVSFAYFITPYAWFPIFAFAIAGVASFLNVLVARI